MADFEDEGRRRLSRVERGSSSEKHGWRRPETLLPEIVHRTQHWTCQRRQNTGKSLFVGGAAWRIKTLSLFGFACLWFWHYTLLKNSPVCLIKIMSFHFMCFLFLTRRFNCVKHLWQRYPIRSPWRIKTHLKSESQVPREHCQNESRSHGGAGESSQVSREHCKSESMGVREWKQTGPKGALRITNIQLNCMVRYHLIFK